MSFLLDFPYVVFVVVAFWLTLTLCVPWVCDRLEDWRANREMKRWERDAEQVIDLRVRLSCDSSRLEAAFRDAEHQLATWRERERLSPLDVER